MAIKEKLKSCNLLVAILMTIAISLIIAISVILILGLFDEVKEKRTICKSPECIKLSNRLHSYGDPSIDPCVDFYKFACGRFTQNTMSPVLSQEQELIVKKVIKEFLRKNHSSNSASDNTIRLAYKKCEAVKDPKVFAVELKKFGLGVMENIRKIGDWPMSNPAWSSTNFNLNDMLVGLAKLRSIDMGLFAIFPILYDLNVVLPPTKTSSSEFKSMILVIMRANNLPIDNNVIDADIKEVMSLLGQIEAFQTKPGKMAYEKLKKNVPSIDFDRVLEALVGAKDFKMALKKVQVFENDAFLDQNLENIIKNTKVRTLSNLLILKYINMFKDFFDNNKDCFETTINDMPQSALLIYVRDYFDKENLELVSQMVEPIRASYLDMFKESEWLSEESKKKAIKKTEKMAKAIGYPRDWETNLEEAHKKLNLKSTDSYYTVMSKAMSFQFADLIHDVVTGSLFDVEQKILVGNANYLSIRNRFRAFIPLLDDPLFDSTYPMYVKLATYGIILGHEIGHGFDNKGIDYDEDGNEKPDYWGATDKKTYMKRAQCLVEQYDNYDDPYYGKKLNGSKVLGEMLADSLGHESVWRTYKRLSTPQDADLIGFEGIDHDRMYFHIAATTWCSQKDTAPLAFRLTLVHPTSIFRVNGPISNRKQFAETFKCPVGSPMNPAKKCQMF